MATVTLSIPDKLKGEMRRHPDIKWSHVFRSMILSRIRQLERLENEGDA